MVLKGVKQLQRMQVVGGLELRFYWKASRIRVAKTIVLLEAINTKAVLALFLWHSPYFLVPIETIVHRA